jgi:hypothetical protein
MPPQIPVKNFDGTYAGPDQQNSSSQIGSNPVALALLRNNDVSAYRILNNLYADIEIINGLNFRSEFSTDYSNRQNSAFIPTYEWGQIKNPTSQLAQSSSQNLFWQWKNYATYTKQINVHNFTVMAAVRSPKVSMGRVHSL